MKTLAPVILGENDVVTLRCKQCSTPTQFVRDFGAGGQVTCTPLSIEGIPSCTTCISDDYLARLLNAGAEVELEN